MTRCTCGILAFVILLSVLVMVALGGFPVANSGRGAWYWRFHSVVLAKVVSVDKRVGDSETITARPLGTLSGRFDSGSTPEVTLSRYFETAYVWSSRKGRMPNAGDEVLMVSLEIDQHRAGYTDPGVTEYMPQGNLSVSIVAGFWDPDVAATLTAIRDRRKDESPAPPRVDIVDPGRGAKYWARHSLLFVELKSAHGAEDGSIALEGHVFETIAGNFDAARLPELAVGGIPRTWYKGLDHFPQPREKVMLVVEENWNGKGEYGPPERKPGFMPAEHCPFWIVHDRSDPIITQTVKAVEALRRQEPLPIAEASPESNERAAAHDPYWQTHSVVYAVAKSVVEPRRGEQFPSVVLRPQIRLSGEFDPGRIPEVTAPIDWKKFGPQFQPLPVDAKVLVLLEWTSDGYRVASDRPGFMPGDRAPICEVKDFDDFRVSDTLNAIQALRSREGSQRAPKPSDPR